MFVCTNKKETKTMENKITLWNDLALKASQANGLAKESRDNKASLFNQLAFLSLQILITGKLQDKASLAHAVSKEGKFFSLRQCVSNAKPLALIIIEQGSLIVKEGKGKKQTEKTFTKAEILESEVPVFTVSSAYRALRTDKEDTSKDLLPDTLTDSQAIQFYLEGSGLTADMLISAEDKAEAAANGHALYAEKRKADMQNNIVETKTAIVTSMKAIYLADEKTGRAILAELQAMFSDTVETQVSIAA